MSKITDLVASLKSMELPKGAESLLSSISSEATALEADRDSALEKVTTRQNENTALKQRAQAAESERDELKGKLPEGSRILPKDEVKLYDAFTALNLKPDEVKTRLEAGDAAHLKAHRSDTREALRKLGYEPTDRLLKDFDGVSLTVSQGDDKKLVGKVKAGEEEKSFGDWTKAQGIDNDLERYRSQPGGVVVLPQVPGNGNGSTKTVKETQESKQQTGDYSL